MDKFAKRLGLDPRAFLGLVVLVAGTLMWVLAFTGGFSSLFSSSSKTIKADFASVEDIVPNDPVRINGVQVGRVSSVSADPGGRGGTLTMELDSTAGKIYKDASASILWRTALGANDAVALTPGNQAAGELVGTIPQSQDSNQVELDQITQAFRGDAQTGMQTTLQQLSPALADHPALAKDLGVLSQIAPQAAVGIGALRGEVQDTDLKNLVHDAGQAAQALSVGTNASETRQFVQSAATTLTAVSSDQTALTQTMQRLAADLPLLTTTFTRTNSDLDHLDPLLAKLTPEVSQVGPTLHKLHPTLVDLRNTLTDATPLLKELRPAVDSLATTARVGDPVVNDLAPSMDRLANKILPGLAEKSPEEGGRPAYAEIGAVGVGIGTLASFFDQNGNFANLTAGLGNYQSQQLLPCQVNFAGTDLLVCQSLSQALGNFFGGGTTLLSQLASKPGAAPVYSPLLSKAKDLESAFAGTQKALAKVRPGLANLLFRSHGGAK